jgi:hypothetical protein
MLEKYTRAELDQLRIFPVLSSFRIIALAQPPPAPGAAGASVGAGRAAGGSAGAAPSWLLEETLPLFSFHTLGTSLDDASRTQILRDLFPAMARGEMDRVLRLVEQLGGARPAGSDAASAAVARSASAVAPASFHLSLRQCIQLLRHHTYYPNDLLPHVRRMLLHEFLPSTQRALLDQVIASSDFAADAEAAADLPTPSLESLLPRVDGGVLHIGSVSYPLNRRLLAPELVPHILFYNIPAHLLLLQDLLRDWIVDAATHGAGSSTGAHSHRRHLLLIGNQGVGKNKICDRLLELLQLEREYMQLHRQWTSHERGWLRAKRRNGAASGCSTLTAMSIFLFRFHSVSVPAPHSPRLRPQFLRRHDCASADPFAVAEGRSRFLRGQRAGAFGDAGPRVGHRRGRQGAAGSGRRAQGTRAGRRDGPGGREEDRPRAAEEYQRTRGQQVHPHPPRLQAHRARQSTGVREGRGAMCIAHARCAAMWAALLLSWSDMVGWLSCSLVVLLVDVSASFFLKKFFFFLFYLFIYFVLFCFVLFFSVTLSS